MVKNQSEKREIKAPHVKGNNWVGQVKTQEGSQGTTMNGQETKTLSIITMTPPSLLCIHDFRALDFLTKIRFTEGKSI